MGETPLVAISASASPANVLKSFPLMLEKAYVGAIAWEVRQHTHIHRYTQMNTHTHTRTHMRARAF